jgi:hypothetical protein
LVHESNGSKFESKLIATPGLVRFVPRSDPSKTLIGQPEDDSIDVGVAVFKGERVPVKIFSGTSVLAPGREIGETAVIDRILSPLAASEVGSIRCIGLNVSLRTADKPLTTKLLN